MKQIDPNLSAENFALELADLQEVIFVLRASFSAKIFRPICLISIRKHYTFVSLRLSHRKMIIAIFYSIICDENSRIDLSHDHSKISQHGCKEGVI